MSTPYNTILRRVLKAYNGIAGTTASAMATNYAVSPLTITQADDPVYNLALAKDVMADIQGRIANEIASVTNPVPGIGNHPWRAYFSSSSVPLSDGDNLPVITGFSEPIIGAWGPALISVDLGITRYPGTPTSMERVRSRQQNPDSIYTTTSYDYCIYGNKIYFADNTVATALLECCGYNRATAAAAIATGTVDMVLPDALADAFIAGTISAMVVEGEYLEQAAVYSRYFEACVVAIRAGATAMPGLMVPMRGMASAGV